MKTIMWLFFLFFSICLLSVLPAKAVSIVGSDLNGNEVWDFSYLSTGGKLDFDLEFVNLAPVSLEVGIDDSTTHVAFAANIYNASSRPWTDFHIFLDDDSVFSEVNYLEPWDGGSFSIDGSGNEVNIFFNVTQPAGFTIGQPVPLEGPLPWLPQPGVDWFIDTSDVRQQEVRTFTMILQPTVDTVIPEPSTLLLIGTGWVGLLLAMRRRRK